MGFPIITPSFFNELKETFAPVPPEEFCDINITAAAVEFVPQLCREETVKRLIAEENILEYNLIDLPEEESAQFMEQSRRTVEAYPQAKYYWQVRTLFMNILQNRRINFEKRLLLLNYGIKTVQGMLTGGQGELIPKFVDEFTADDMDYGKILDYFKDVRPNPGWSLSDGISLLKSLAKPNAAYKDVLGQVYSALGVSGPETLKMTDMKRYIELRGEWSQWAAGEKSRYIENVMINYLWFYSIPYSDPRFDLWEHFVFYCSLYNAVKVMLVCFGTRSDEDFVKAVTAFDTALRASDPQLMGRVIMTVKNAGQTGNGDMAILTLS